MQMELDAMDTAVPIRILGINERGLESGNAGIIEGRTLPWLQPPADQDVWSLWQVEYRDVVILGPGNEPITSYNLTVHDLADPIQYEELKNLLQTAAEE